MVFNNIEKLFDLAKLWIIPVYHWLEKMLTFPFY